MTAFDISAYRSILESETNTGADINKELMDQIRENLEALLMLTFCTGDSGTATSDPGDNTSGILVDTGANYGTDVHNGRVLLITSGLAIGNMYQIDDTSANNINCDGDNLYADGVRSGDSYRVLYNVKDTTGGHTHNGIDSAFTILRQLNLGDYAAGTVLEASSDAEVTTTSTTYVKLKEFYIPRGGTINVQFEMRPTTNSAYAYAQVYHNGVAIGTEQSNNSSTYANKSENISGFAAGDLVQIYAHGTNNDTVYIKNARLYVADSFQAHVIT